MPLLPGKKNIGRNIETEERAGKPHKQAVAIALNKARGKDASQFKPGDWVATSEHPDSVGEVTRINARGDATIRFYTPKSARLPFGHRNDEFWPLADQGGLRKANGAEKARAKDVQPVGTCLQCKIHPPKKGEHFCSRACERGWMYAHYPEDMKRLERAKDSHPAVRKLALAKHAAGITRSQDMTELPMPIKTSSLVPLPAGENNEESYAPRRAKDVMAGTTPKCRGFKADDTGRRCKRCGRPRSAHFVARQATDAENTSHKPKWMPDTAATHANLDRMHKDVVGQGYKWKYSAGGGSDKGSIQHVYRKGGNEIKRPTAIIKERVRGNHEVTYRPGTSAKATDALVALPEQRSGSAPADHLARAAQYEIQGDRARALDSYRAAASGFRKAEDRTGEARAREGVEACQARFAMQYDHPGKGHVKVCDSAEQALRTALERTRAGEAVTVVGKTVRPGRASARDASPVRERLYQRMHRLKKEGTETSDIEKMFKRNDSTDAIIVALGILERAVKAKDDTGGPGPVDEPKELAMPDPVPVGDEHEGFAKLEHSLAHRKGITDPKALAAAIGRKKYGAAGMAKKAAAGRAKDADAVAYRGYLLKPLGLLAKEWDVTKNGHRIATKPTLAEAKKVVDEMHALGLAEDREVQPV